VRSDRQCETLVADVLRIEGVWKGFDRGRDRVSVLEDVSLNVAAGELIAVVGGRDQGKTTLIRIASGMLPADRGTVRVCGVELSSLKDRQLAWMLAREVGVAAVSGPEVRVSVREYVELSLAACVRWRRDGWRARERRLRVTELLAQLDLAGCADMRWDELSDLQRVLVELAQAVAVRPRLLLIDDLVDGFGIGRKQAVVDLLEGFVADFGCGVLMAVADPASAMRARELWQLGRGQLKLMAGERDHGDAGARVVPLRARRGTRSHIAES
jgi:ABC-type cobalamin/Fe3+-siderophores transport system ATPase subunit